LVHEKEGREFHSFLKITKYGLVFTAETPMCKMYISTRYKKYNFAISDKILTSMWLFLQD
jgi:hypothetical protein